MATIFDKLNQVYKEYLEAEQSYTVVSDNLKAEHTAQSLNVCFQMVVCLIAGYGVWTEPRKRSSETSGQNSGRH